MFRQLTSFLVALLGASAFGGAYDDYVKYTGGGTVSAFDNGAYWDDGGNPPGPGKNYYIGKDYYYGWNGETGKTFKGDRLVVASTFFFGGNSGTTVGFGPDPGGRHPRGRFVLNDCAFSNSCMMIVYHVPRDAR